MKTSCIRQPENNRYIQVHEWQIRFCRKNHCAALMLSFFTAWHDWKVKNDQYYRKFNDIAEMHGDERTHNQNAYLFFSADDLIDGCMGFYGKNAINEGLNLLASLNVITIHKNPNPRYHFDKTKYFKFYPHVCNRWIEENYPIKDDDKESGSQVYDFTDSLKEANRGAENHQRSAENSRPLGELGNAITYTTNKKLQTNTNNNDVENNFDEKQKNDLLHKQSSYSINTRKLEPSQVVESLINEGFPVGRLKAHEIFSNIEKMITNGATIRHFVDAYTETRKLKGTELFSFNYLLKVVETKLKARKMSKEVKPNYEPEYSKSKDWMGDLLI